MGKEEGEEERETINSGWSQELVPNISYKTHNLTFLHFGLFMREEQIHCWGSLEACRRDANAGRDFFLYSLYIVRQVYCEQWSRCSDSNSSTETVHGFTAHSAPSFRFEMP